LAKIGGSTKERGRPGVSPLLFFSQEKIVLAAEILTGSAEPKPKMSFEDNCL